MVLLLCLWVSYVPKAVQAQQNRAPQSAAQKTVSKQDVLAALGAPDRIKCLQTLRILSQKNSASTGSILLATLAGKDQRLRLRAVWALALLPLKTQPRVIKALASLLQSDPDRRVRLCCAIGLMSAKGPLVEKAYLHAVADSDEKVGQIACGELGERGGAKAEAALFRTLTTRSWDVRLSACKALITLKAADQRVVRTLEKMATEPEAKEYDAQIEEFKKQERQLSTQHAAPPIETWGKVGTILEQARRIADRKR